MATVYLCHDVKTDARVAVKVLRPELGSAVVVERFLREIQFASELDHPRIPKVLDSGLTGEVPFYVMTYVEGESLRERLDREKQLPVEEAVRIASAVIEPMTYAHRAGIVHRDIKPGNILVGPESVYVLDFGIARAILASADERLTSTGMAVGTPAYMSPEQALADGTLDARSDVYSLACVTYEMIAGIPPFVGATPQAIMARRFGSAPPPLSETREGVPPHVEHAVSKALCRAPADRWQSASEFGRALVNAGTAESLHDVKSHVEGHRKSYGRAIAGVAAVALLAAGAYAYSSGRDHVLRAQAAIEDWNFQEARSELDKAVAKDPADPAAQVWLAGMMFLQKAPEDQWKPYALRAMDAAGSLEQEDSLLAAALADIPPHSHGNCDVWRDLASASSDKARSTLASLAQADCLAEDDAIVADRSSPSGYRFRSSHHQASMIYDGLLTRNSGDAQAYAVLMPRLLNVMPTMKTNPRTGFLESEEPEFFAAFPSLVSDSIAYVPYEVGSTGVFRARDPVSLQRAVDRNTRRLRTLAAGWVDVDPRDPDARETYGLILERNEELSGTERSALEQIRQARRLAAELADSSRESYMTTLRLALTETRLLLKKQSFDSAGLLAASILEWPQRPSPDVVADEMLGSLAALTGRISRLHSIHSKHAATYRLQTSSPVPEYLPAEVGADAWRLADFSTMGGPADSIIAVSDRVGLKLAGLFPAARLSQVRTALLRRPYGLAAPAVGPRLVGSLDDPTDPFVNAARSLAGGDLRRARAHADSLSTMRADFAPGEITMDGVLEHAWLLTAIDDTAGAVRLLDNALRGLSKMPANTMREEISAALVRAIIMRAEIASKQDDRRTAEEWSSAAVALWGRGDPEPRARVMALRKGR
jgi:tRNA A-37 threonylcarbamoyl transferase component Bud32